MNLSECLISLLILNGVQDGDVVVRMDLSCLLFARCKILKICIFSEFEFQMYYYQVITTPICISKTAQKCAALFRVSRPCPAGQSFAYIRSMNYSSYVIRANGFDIN